MQCAKYGINHVEYRDVSYQCRVAEFLELRRLTSELLPHVLRSYRFDGDCAVAVQFVSLKHLFQEYDGCWMAAGPSHWASNRQLSLLLNPIGRLKLHGLVGALDRQLTQCWLQMQTLFPNRFWVFRVQPMVRKLVPMLFDVADFSRCRPER